MILNLNRHVLGQKRVERRTVDPKTRQRMDEAAKRSAQIDGPRVDNALKTGTFVDQNDDETRTLERDQKKDTTV